MLLLRAAASVIAFLSSLENTAAFVVAPTCPADLQWRQSSNQLPVIGSDAIRQLREGARKGVGAPRLDHWRRVPSFSERGLRHVLFLEP